MMSNKLKIYNPHESEKPKMFDFLTLHQNNVWANIQTKFKIFFWKFVPHTRANKCTDFPREEFWAKVPNAIF